MLIDLGPGELGSPFRSLENHIIAVIIVAQKNPMPGVRCYSYINLHRIFGWIGQTGATGCFWFHVQPMIFHCHLWVGHRRVWKFYHVLSHIEHDGSIPCSKNGSMQHVIHHVQLSEGKLDIERDGFHPIPAMKFPSFRWRQLRSRTPWPSILSFLKATRRLRKNQKRAPVAETGSPTSFWSQENLFFPILNLIYV